MAAHPPLELDPYVIATLLPDLVRHDRRPSAFLIYLVIAATGGRLAASYGQLAERAGVSRRAAQDAVAHLVKRGLIAATRRGTTETSEYWALAPWRR